MNIRQGIVFAILMQGNGGIMNKHPSYLAEKLEAVELMKEPERLLDPDNREIFNRYCHIGQLEWEE